MKHIVRAVTLLSLLAGAANAQTQHLKGSDTLALFTRDVIRTLMLGSGNDPLVTPCPATDALCYDGGGSGTGYGAGGSGHARETGQGINPASRPVNAGDQMTADGDNLDFVVPQCEVARDGIAIMVNTAGNGDLQNIVQTTIGNIFSCAQNSGGTFIARFWDQIPGSTRGHHEIVKYTRDGLSGTTDVFTNKTKILIDGVVSSFVPLPSSPNQDQLYWRTNYPNCVRDILGDGATQVIGYSVANDPDAIGYAGLPAIQDGNYALGVCDDQNAAVDCTDPTQYFTPSLATIESGAYFYARPLFLANVEGANGVPYSLPTDQQTVLDYLCNPDTSCANLDPIVTRNNFFPAQRCYNP